MKRPPQFGRMVIFNSLFIVTDENAISSVTLGSGVLWHSETHLFPFRGSEFLFLHKFSYFSHSRFLMKFKGNRHQAHINF